MDSERWTHVRAIFDEVVDLESPQREARLVSACGDDLALRREVESLLSYDRPAHDTIAQLVSDAALAAAGGHADAAAMPVAIGRYRVLAKIGEGGMGEVFLAEDTSLHRRVALKLPPAAWSGDPQTRARLQHEARAAATLNHPNVCVIHEVGDGPDGRPFIAMEYVEGETLAARIARGRLPAHEVLALGEQIAGALHEAHAKGIVHRDLKPSNIMLTPHGVKLLDFGLANLTSTAFAGTIPYMSPEQVRAEDVDHRADLYALGVVLYEAVTGCRPFDAPTPRATCDAILTSDPVPPRAIIATVPAALDRVIRRALAKPREARYQSAAELRADLAEPSRMTAAGRLGIALAAVAVAMVIFAYWLTTRSPSYQAPSRDTVLIADFVNATGDPAFDATLQQVLAGQLQQTPFLTVFPADGVRETLRLMSRSSEDRLTAAVAQEICRRRGLRAWIGGSIAPLGRGYVVTLEAVDGRRGTTLTSERVEAEGRIDVLPALGKIAIQLRQQLGEPFQSIQKFSTPVEQATTDSLDALRAYALGVQQAGSGNYPVAVSLYERAVQIDPRFAVAHEALARERLNSGYSHEIVSAAATRAYELRDRATEQERSSIAALYHSSVTGDLEQAIEAAELWKTTFPSEWRPHHLLGDLYNSTAQYDKAVDAAREAVRLNPDIAAAYSNLAGALFALDRFDEARTVYRQAMTRGLDAPEYHAFLWRIAYYQGDAAGMRRELDWAAGSSTWALNMASLAAALQGRWRDAQRESLRATEFFAARDLKGYAALSARYETVAAALVGDCATAKQRGPSAFGPSQSSDEQARAIVALAMCGDTSRASAFADRLKKQYPLDTMLNRVWFPLIRAAEWLDRDPGLAIEALRVAAPYEGAAESWPIYLRGLALLRVGRGADAGVEFQKIIDHRGRTFWAPFYPLAHIGLARAAAMTGDTAAAERLYRDVFALWEDADADLPALADARKDYERLRAATSR